MAVYFNVERLRRWNKFKDIRIPIPGDSFTWSWTQPLYNFTGIAVHHSAGPDTQTPDDIANFHINHNGWGGIGYHFLIDKRGILYYVGDLGTVRAHVANQNHRYVGICLIGNFVDNEPTDNAKWSLQETCHQMIENFPALSGIQYWSQVKCHNEIFGQATACPGSRLAGFVRLLRETKGAVL